MNAGEYDMRIFVPTSKWPVKFLYMVGTPPNEVSQVRRDLGGELCSATTVQDLDGDHTTWKLRTIFMPAWEIMRDSGKLEEDLWIFLNDVSVLWCCDTQQMESINSIIKIIIGRCPAIQLPLLSARVGMRKILGLYGSDELRQEFLEETAKHVVEAKTMDKDNQRWKTVTSDEWGSDEPLTTKVLEEKPLRFAKCSARLSLDYMGVGHALHHLGKHTKGGKPSGGVHEAIVFLAKRNGIIVAAQSFALIGATWQRTKVLCAVGDVEYQDETEIKNGDVFMVLLPLQWRSVLQGFSLAHGRVADDKLDKPEFPLEFEVTDVDLRWGREGHDSATVIEGTLRMCLRECCVCNRRKTGKAAPAEGAADEIAEALEDEAAEPGAGDDDVHELDKVLEENGAAAEKEAAAAIVKIEAMPDLPTAWSAELAGAGGLAAESEVILNLLYGEEIGAGGDHARLRLG